MVHVQDCDLVVVLAQDEEEGVHELNELGEVVPPEHTDDLGGRGRQRLPGSALNPRIPPHRARPPPPPTGPAKASHSAVPLTRTPGAGRGAAGSEGRESSQRSTNPFHDSNRSLQAACSLWKEPTEPSEEENHMKGTSAFRGWRGAGDRHEAEEERNQGIQCQVLPN